ncbi:hypothetical protein F4775DRAFT_217135 [Biscogniauxia sp. FL1348]|nr:hypothetical protein F4775DRAFT_217135 [Biscogniauxia sp. FL1348]
MHTPEEQDSNPGSDGKIWLGPLTIVLIQTGSFSEIPHFHSFLCTIHLRFNLSVAVTNLPHLGPSCSSADGMRKESARRRKRGRKKCRETCEQNKKPGEEKRYSTATSLSFSPFSPFAACRPFRIVDDIGNERSGVAKLNDTQAHAYIPISEFFFLGLGRRRKKMVFPIPTYVGKLQYATTPNLTFFFHVLAAGDFDHWGTSWWRGTVEMRLTYTLRVCR